MPVSYIDHPGSVGHFRKSAQLSQVLAQSAPTVSDDAVRQGLIPGLVARILFKNELLARLWFKEVRKASGSISQGKDLTTRERQAYGLKSARISLKSHAAVT
jgi:hypothetical protein